MLSKILISNITTDEELQPRVEIDNETFLEYKSFIESGTKFPPVVIVSDGSTNWLVDGYHRYYAYKDLNINEIEADIQEGNRQDAILLSLQANATHGKRRTSGDYRRAYEIAVRNELVSPNDVNKLMKILMCAKSWAYKLTEEARLINNAERDRAIIAALDTPETQAATAARLGISQPTVSAVQSEERRRRLLCQNNDYQDFQSGISDNASVSQRLPEPESEPNLASRQEPQLETPLLPQSLPDDDAHNHRAQGTGDNEWYTPARYIDAAWKVMGEIDLDPASSNIANKTVEAKEFFTIFDDGLNKDWSGRVWLNPPYTQPHIMQFAEKMVDEFNSERVSEAIMLTHNYTDTAWFHLLWSNSNAVCFTRGRIGFLSPTGEKAAPTQGQAFFYFGKNINAFTKEFSNIGAIGIKYAI